MYYESELTETNEINLEISEKIETVTSWSWALQHYPHVQQQISVMGRVQTI
jgi:hypothetical protein